MKCLTFYEIAFWVFAYRFSFVETQLGLCRNKPLGLSSNKSSSLSRNRSLYLCRTRPLWLWRNRSPSLCRNKSLDLFRNRSLCFCGNRSLGFCWQIFPSPMIWNWELYLPFANPWAQQLANIEPTVLCYSTSKHSMFILNFTTAIHINSKHFCHSYTIICRRFNY